MGRVPLLPEVGVFAVAEGAEGDDARIQPGVAHIAHPVHTCATFGAGDRDRIDIRAVGGVVTQHIQPAGGALLELIITADDLEITAGFAFPDGQVPAPNSASC